MSVSVSSFTAPKSAAFGIVAVVAAASLGAVTTSLVFAPVLVLCLIATGLFVLAGSDIAPTERLILVPAIGLSAFALSSLVIPLVSALGIVARPIHSPAVLTVATALPVVVSLVYWASGPNSQVPSMGFDSRYLIPTLPVLLGGGGALVQREMGFVVQNYAVMGLLVVLGPLLLYWAQTEFEAGLSLYGLAAGVLLSHTLVTGYSVGIDIQMSLHTLDRVTETGIWPLNDLFFLSGAEGIPLSDLIEYIGSDLSHTALPVIVGVPVLFETVGNIPPDAVFDIIYVGIFALTPVGIFRMGREQLSIRDAFVAGLVFIAYYRFFHTSPGKQHMAQFFVAALLVAWLTKLEHPRKKVATALLAIGIVFSHYAVTFLFFAFLTGGYVCSKWYDDSLSDLSLLFVGYFYSLLTLWYVVITGGQKPLTALSAIAISVEKVISESGVQHRSGANVAAEQTLLVDQINLGLHGLLFGAIALGVLVLLYRALTTREPTFTTEFDSLSVWFFGLLGVSMVATGHLGIDRALDISLVVLAPVAILGIRDSLSAVGTRLSVPTLPSHTHRIALVFVVLFFAFSSGLVYEAAREPATSAINLHEEQNSVMFSEAEFEAARWVASNRNNSTVYVGQYATTAFQRLDGRSPDYVRNYKNYTNQVDIEWDEPGYIFIRRSELTSNPDGMAPIYELHREEYQSLRDRTEIVFENSDIIVLRVDPDRPETTQPSQ